MTTTEQLQQTIEQLQINQHYNEDSIAALETTVAKQHQQIQLLDNKLQLLSEFIKSLKWQDGIKKPEDEVPPPHY